MVEEDKIRKIIYDVIEEINVDLHDDSKLDKTEDGLLYGGSGKLDSLGLVNFMVKVEQEIQDALGITVALANEKAMSNSNSPFRNVAALVDYIKTLLNGN